MLSWVKVQEVGRGETANCAHFLLCHCARSAQLAGRAARCLRCRIIILVAVKKVRSIVHALLDAALLPELRELDVVHVVLPTHLAGSAEHVTYSLL